MAWCVRGCGSSKAPLSGLHLATLCKQFRFTPHEILLYRKRFENITRADTFTLTQFRDNMGLLGLESTSILADRIFAVMNKTGNGKVSFDEYLLYMDVLTMGNEDEKAELSFKLITKGGLEPITYPQFADMIVSIWKLYNTITGTQVHDSATSIQHMFAQLDLNHDSVIDMREYKHCWRTNRQLFEWFEVISGGMQHSPRLERRKDEREVVLMQLEDLEKEVGECLEMLEPGECASEPGHLEDVVTEEDQLWEADYPTELPPCSLLGNMPILTASRRSLGQITPSTLQITDPLDLPSPSLSLKLHSVLSKIAAMRLYLQDDHTPPITPPPIKRSISSISWGDEHWNLIVNMMLGIQKAVSSVEEISLPVTAIPDSVYTEKRLHSTLQAAANSEKVYLFKDYSPVVFSLIRQLYSVPPSDYVKSLGVEKMLESWLLGSFSSLEGLCSSGKSGSFFFYSEDGKYMLKTIQKEEFLLLRRMLKPYFLHLSQVRNTLITRIFGLHKVEYRKKGRKTKVYFIVMGNLFRKNCEIHSRFDLKGSRVGRSTEKALDSDIARKDLDFDAIGMKILLGPLRRTEFLSIIDSDCSFLQSNGVIDYSVLIGIHGLSGNCVEMKRGEEDVVPFAERNEGGLVSSDGTMLYFIGIIDVLTYYGSKKKLEHAAKSIIYDDEGISCVPPKQYADRFRTYLASIVE